MVSIVNGFLPERVSKTYAVYGNLIKEAGGVKSDLFPGLTLTAIKKPHR
jgi:hypothetical protein